MLGHPGVALPGFVRACAEFLPHHSSHCAFSHESHLRIPDCAFHEDARTGGQNVLTCLSILRLPYNVLRSLQLSCLLAVETLEALNLLHLLPDIQHVITRPVRCFILEHYWCILKNYKMLQVCQRCLPVFQRASAISSGPSSTGLESSWPAAVMAFGLRLKRSCERYVLVWNTALTQQVW